MSAGIVGKIISAWKHLLQTLVTTRDSITHVYNALRDFVLWILHLPKAAATAIARWISSIGQIVSNVGQVMDNIVRAVLRGVVIGLKTLLLLLLLYIAVLAAVKVFRIYQHEKDLRAQRELHARRREEAERRARMREAERRRAEESRKQQEQRARMREDERRRRARAEDDQKQQEERERCRKALAARQRAANDRLSYHQWLCHCEALLSCRETMTRFPDPPFWPCPAGCRPSGVLDACLHSIERLFKASGKDLKEVLWKERLQWHPDKFEKCPDASRERLKAKAEEMFKLVQGLLDGVLQLQT